MNHSIRTRKHTNENPAKRIPLARLATLCLAFLLLGNLAACRTQPPAYGGFEEKVQPALQASPTVGANPATEVITLREGDTVKITFPGAPSLNAVQQIRRDGRITLPMLGEFSAAGLTPVTMEKELLKLYGPQLQSKEVSVSVESSAFPVYVSGAVLRPGKIMSDRPINALEAIVEAGGFDTTKANMKSVTVIRQENGRTVNYKVNLKRVLQGQETQQFKLQPNDIIFVPERFTWF
jgi:polysaccharide biosynthesis/export protein